MNLGQSLDDIANIDPKGYGVCKMLYCASRKLTKAPLTMNAAKKLIKTLKKESIVYIITGFVLATYNKPETNGGATA